MRKIAEKTCLIWSVNVINMIFVQIIIDSVRIPYILHELNLPETGVTTTAIARAM